MLNGAHYYLGIYNTIEEAASARQSAIDNYTTNSTLPTKSETKVKFCKSCNTEKPVSEFYYVPSHGFSWMCKECSKEYARQKRAEKRNNVKQSSITA